MNSSENAQSSQKCANAAKRLEELRNRLDGSSLNVYGSNFKPGYLIVNSNGQLTDEHPTNEHQQAVIDPVGILQRITPL